MFVMADFGEASCSLLLSVLATLVTQSGSRKLTFIMMVAFNNLLVEYGHCTVKQVYKNVLNSIVEVTNGLGQRFSNCGPWTTSGPRTDIL
jgi:hypothetical protein